mgnify:CR=1 FL=1
MILENVTYVPTLAIRASEMNGLEFLPGATKDRMTPCFLLAPWANSKTLDRAITRIERAFPNRHYFLDIDRNYQTTNDQSVAQQEYMSLLDDGDAFRNWIAFVTKYEWVWPCVQIEGQSEREIRRQIEAIQSLRRPYCMRVSLNVLPININEIVQAFAADGSADFAIILEGGWTDDPLTFFPRFTGFIRETLAPINAAVPVVCSCTSIPKIFTEFNSDNPILVEFSNRQLLEQISRNTNRETVIYGDWGSTRPREPGGFANRPLDRIDYPMDRGWYIARNKDKGWDFCKAAKAIVNSEGWDGELGIWGEELIQQTTINEELGIDTPQKNVAARVNIHLHKQAFFGEGRIDPIAFEEDWED